MPTTATETAFSRARIKWYARKRQAKERTKENAGGKPPCAPRSYSEGYAPAGSKTAAAPPTEALEATANAATLIHASTTGSSIFTTAPTGCPPPLATMEAVSMRKTPGYLLARPGLADCEISYASS